MACQKASRMLEGWCGTTTHTVRLAAIFGQWEAFEHLARLDLRSGTPDKEWRRCESSQNASVLWSEPFHPTHIRLELLQPPDEPRAREVELQARVYDQRQTKRAHDWVSGIFALYLRA